VVVIRHGLLVFEHYRPGTSRDTLRDVQSVTKSVVCALVGIALHQGLIADLDQPVLELLPDVGGTLTDPRAKQVTLRHILTFTAGFEPESTTDRWMRRLGTGDTLRRAMSRPIVSTPGERFSYDNTTAYIISAVLTKAARQNMAKYAEQHLFGPLAITEYEWPADAAGNNPAHAGLHMKTRDMAKLGQLFLALGRWRGREIVQQSYATASTDRQSAGGPPSQTWAYGFMWWVVPTPAPRKAFLASGLGGQFIYVDPSKDIVVATTAHASQASTSRLQAITLIREHILPAAL
jgi:CubicO group peptidase (beta-lactamase class C family)